MTFWTGRQSQRQQNENQPSGATTKLKSSHIAEEAINKMQRQPAEWERIFLSHVSDEGLILKICKELIRHNRKKKEVWLKHGQRIWTDIFLKNTYRWTTGTWKCPQRHQSPWKRKSKPPWNVASHLLECVLPKRQKRQALARIRRKGSFLCALMVGR